MLTSPPSQAPARSAGLLVVLALAPLWLVGMFGRGLWTPDEPREADIAWRMSLQSDRTLPQLADRLFLEKPPLSYWMSAGGITLFGDSGGAARAPNFLYAVIGVLSVLALALAMQTGTLAAIIAGLVTMSALIAFRVSVWLAPDACLFAGCALALLGAWRGYGAAPGWPKVRGYALMHVGAAIGFMAKSAPGWLVPALALLALIAWERRWVELRRWELYAGFLLQILIIGPWLLAVAHEANAAEALSTLFWHNLMGRFTPVASSPALDYTSGHHNSPGKYLRELPLYLLPWTLVVAAALVRSLPRVRTGAPGATAWRFALCASLPFLALLSVAATARDVYAAPALVGFGLLAGLWVQEAQASPSRLDQLALRFSRYLSGLIAWALAGALLVFAAAGEAPEPRSVAIAVLLLGAAHFALWRAARAARRGDFPYSLAWIYSGYVAAICLAALVALPVIDRWQDLPGLARRIQADTAHQSLALLDPDETTLAMLDRGYRTRIAILTTAANPVSTPDAGGASGSLVSGTAWRAEQVVTRWFHTAGDDARVLVLLPGHAPGAVSEWLGRLLPLVPPGDGLAGELSSAGSARLVRRYELPQGRRYALLGPPEHSMN
ncbi:MAG: glycosyltransferase family 39 protein [Gammaproteobacteria bacterium]|nr:glycosyltransferase family 39 protein [Gammaproteobacteria bacterium]